MSCQNCRYGISQRARIAPREEDDQGDRRLPDDRGRRPRHGRPVRRQGQLGAAADSRRPAAARADPFSLVAVNVDSGYKEYKHDVIARTCEARGWEYRIEHTGIGELIEDILDDNETPCSLCARLRRGVLYRIANEVGATKIALGHHADDFIETLLLNLFFAGALKAMPAKLRVRRRRARGDPAAGLRRRGRSAGVRQGVRAADHRLLLSGLRRSRPCSGSAPSAC